MFDGPEPIYLQIAEHLRRQVLDGTLQPGDHVMSTTQYATTYRINPATAAKAFGLLVDEGVLYKQRGLGMYVSEGARDLLRERRRAAFFTDRLDAVLDEARTLGIGQDELIDHVRKRSAQ
ncbi:GntR family transcriptional regulator [Georgenia deserti]|uniref:GntR family transcriptional regulator n=1 Tax=Georgenia deserti TaxID=2093781 RepID=A0ABW4LB41_9MICO